MDNVRIARKDWNPEARLDSLMLEVQFEGGDSAGATARMLREHALIAAESIAHLSVHSRNETVRLKAATYIVDRVLASSVSHDIQIAKEQVTLVGQALAGVVRHLGMKYNFDPDSAEVRAIAHETMLQLAAATDGRQQGQGLSPA
jgi:hypothetical protein